MKAQLQDISGKKHKKGTGVRWSVTGRLLCIIIFTVHCSLFTVHYSYAQQSGEQKPQAVQQPVQQKSLEEERLNILRSDIQKEIDEYKKLKKELEEARKEQEEKKQENLAKVSKMFEAMPAEEAAKKLEKLDEETAVTILNALKPKTAGKILAQMEDERAASLSKKILHKVKPFPEKSSQ